MRDLKNKLTSSKNTKNIKNRRGKSFGYQVLGFGAGGSVLPFIAATGGTIVEDGNFKIHIFTGPGTFCVSSAGTDAGSNAVDYMVVAGGGGATYGGGGAGGFRNSVSCAGSLPLSVQGYPITVGGGGTANPSARGANSVFSSITSTGGGASGIPLPANAPGGSGAGGGYQDSPSPNAGGLGNTPPVSPPQGNNGGTGHGIYGTNNNGSGGAGGASAVGGPSGGSQGGGTGGAGAPTLIFGSTPTAPSYGESGPAPGRYFAGGGAGTNSGPATPAKEGGVGGGGNGGPTVTSPGTSGSTNMGGGGGDFAGAGGSGIVVIRYKFQ